MKSAQVRKTNSPNAKKVSAIGWKSPNSKKTSSPISTAPDNTENVGQIAHDSNAVQTAKKLKRILETNETPPSTSTQTVEVDDASKRATTLTTSTKSKSQNSHMLLKPIKKQKRIHEYHDSGDEGENAEDNVKKDDPKVNCETDAPKEISPPEIQWTREEDRMLLEQIKAGLDSNTADITEFSHQFPNKNQEQIRDRLGFLIDFLTKLRNKK